MAPATARDLGAWNIRVSDPTTLVFRRPWEPEDQTVSVENTTDGLALLHDLETLETHFGEEWFVGIRSGPAEDGRCILWAQVPGEAAVYAMTVADLKRKLIDALAVLNL